MRQLLGYLAGARGHSVPAGAPEQIADLIEDWFTDGAADGFNIMPPLFPAQLEMFSAEVIPILQRRWLFCNAHQRQTRRAHFRPPPAQIDSSPPAWRSQLQDTP